MAKRGYKLQEFEAHSANVNCVKIGKKGGRLLITGGDDNKVNLWSIGKPTSLMNLCGHTTPIESVAFDSSEVLVVAGASTGVIKLWDLEEAKIVRTLTGHRSYCTALEFHPFGEFFASGSMDTNLKIWDIRKKGCIHTYKGHTRGISNIRFSPDGRWVVSGGLDNVVKVWDLTAGKLLHDFKFHEGHIRSIDFHPLEFLLATGSADKTVKFWDLETFELIGSTRPEATGVRAVTFHPDGKTLFCGQDDSLKVYSWEPVICHDAIDMGWSTLGDLCTHDGKLLGCSHYQNSVAVWVADIKLIDQYGSGLLPKETVGGDQKSGDGVRSTMGLHCSSPECDPKDIKTIYVDSGGENRATQQKNGSFNSPQAVFPLESNELADLPTQKHAPPMVMHTKTKGQTLNNSFTVPSIVPRESTDAKDLFDGKRETIAAARTNSSMVVKPAPVQLTLPTKYDVEKLSVAVESGSVTNMASSKKSAMDPKFNARLEVNDDSCEDKHSSIKSVVEKFDRVLSPQTPSSQGKDNEESPNSSKETSSVKPVNGGASVRGRIRSLVERFERRESRDTTEDQATDTSVTVAPEIDKPQTDDKPSMLIGETQISGTEPTSPNNQGDPQISERRPTSANDQSESQMLEREPASAIEQSKPQIIEREPIPANDQSEPQTVEEEPTSTNDQRRELGTSESDLASGKDQRELQISQAEHTPPSEQKGRRGIFGRVRSVNDQKGGSRMLRREPVSANDQRGSRSSGRESVSLYDQRRGPRNFGREPASPNDQRREPRISVRESTSAADQRELRIARRRPTLASRGHRNFVRELSPANDQIIENQMSERELISATDQMREIQIFERVATSANNQRGDSEIYPRESTSTPDQREEPQISERRPTSANDQSLTEDLLQTHDIFLSTLRSRLTKLQVVRHFWERRDIKGAVNGLRKLPDLAVQADVISVLMDKMEILTLDLFSSLLPVLFGLLDSKTERHANISLEMLLKLVAVFGSVIGSTISAPPAVGVDLQAEQRLECCKQCFSHLQKIQRMLPLLIRRGSLVARYARELDLVLQQLYS